MPLVRNFVSLLPVALVALVALASASIARAQDDTAALEQMVARINQMRSAAGIPTLSRDARLDRAARTHCVDMSTNDILEHVSPRTGDPTARVAAVGIPNVRVAENIALNADVAAAHAALVSSDAHRANLLDPLLTHIGVAASRSARGVYVTEVFATLPTAAPPSALPPPAVAPPSAGEVVAPAAAAELALPAVAEQIAPPAVAVPPAAPVAPAPAAAQPQAGARRVAGYWVFSQSRWWYYPLPADARPGQPLQAAQLPPGAAPPGYGQQGSAAPLPVYAAPRYAAPSYGVSGYAPPIYAPPPVGYYPGGGAAIYYGPGRYAPPPAPFGGWSPRRHRRWR